MTLFKSDSFNGTGGVVGGGLHVKGQFDNETVESGSRSANEMEIAGLSADIQVCLGSVPG